MGDSVEKKPKRYESVMNEISDMLSNKGGKRKKYSMESKMLTELVNLRAENEKLRNELANIHEIRELKEKNRFLNDEIMDLEERLKYFEKQNKSDNDLELDD